MNLRWVMCAALGRLPKQRRNELTFATAPRGLDARVYRDPTLSGEWAPSDSQLNYAVSDVFFAEVCLLSRLCANSDQLFRTRVGEIFTCDFDRDGFVRLANDLLQAVRYAY